MDRLIDIVAHAAYTTGWVILAIAAYNKLKKIIKRDRNLVNDEQYLNR